MTSKISATLHKNFQMIFNSKISSLVLLLGPIFLILIIGSALKDTSIKNVQIGVYAEHETEFSNDFIQKLQERSFVVEKKENLEECKRAVVDSKAHGCLELKQANIGVIDNQLENSGYYDLILHIDFSKQRIVWNIIGSISGLVNTESRNLRRGAVEDISGNIDKTLEEINLRKTELNRALIQVQALKQDISKLNSEGENIALVKKELNKSKSEINRLDDNFENLSRTYGMTEEYSPGYRNVRTSIFVLKESIGYASDYVEDVEILEKADRMSKESSKIESNILQAKTNLDKISTDLGEANDLDVDRAIDPLFLSYQSISKSKDEGSTEQNLGFLDYLFPSFVMLFLLIICIVFATTISIRERSSNAFIRNVTSGVSGFKFVISNFITCLFIATIQTAIIFGVALWFIKINILQNILNTAISISLFSSIFILFGITIGYLFNSQESAVSASICIALLFFIFSPLVTPVETLPASFGDIIKLTPLVILETRLRLGLIFGAPFNLSISEITSLSFTFLLLLSALMVSYKLSKNKEI